MKKLITILFIGLFLTGCAKLPNPPFGAGNFLTEIPAIVETDLGDSNINVFKNLTTGEIKEVEITTEEYRALGLKNATQPRLAGYKWLYSQGGRKNISTSTPTLSDNQYYKAGIDEASSTLIMIKLPNKIAQIIKKDYIVNNKLTTEGLSLIK